MLVVIGIPARGTEGAVGLQPRAHEFALRLAEDHGITRASRPLPAEHAAVRQQRRERPQAERIDIHVDAAVLRQKHQAQHVAAVGKIAHPPSEDFGRGLHSVEADDFLCSLPPRSRTFVPVMQVDPLRPVDLVAGPERTARYSKAEPGIRHEPETEVKDIGYHAAKTSGGAERKAERPINNSIQCSRPSQEKPGKTAAFRQNSSLPAQKNASPFLSAFDNIV